jgi:hypothetical protein
MAKNYHCCATCKHFRIERLETKKGHVAKCSRLGYETKSFYQFNCWDPRPDIVERMNNSRKPEAP